MNVLQLISNDNFIATSKTLIKQFGLIEANIIGLFASIAQFNNSKHPENEGWFYATYERLNDELGLSQYVASKPIEKLIEAGILIDKKQGVPCRRFFKFNEEKLLNSLLSRNLITGNRENQQLEPKKLHNKEFKNSITSDEETIQPEPEKIGRNNKPNKKTDNKPNQAQVFSEEKVWTAEALVAEVQNKNAKKILNEYAHGLAVQPLAEQWLSWREDQKLAPADNMPGAFLSWVKNRKGKSDVVEKKKAMGNPDESAKIIKIRGDIKQRICWRDHNVSTSYFLYFEGRPVKEEGGIYTITVSDPKALKYAEVLAEISVKIEVK